MFRKQSSRSKLTSAIRPVVEAFEPRRMLAADLSDGVLLVDGTRGNDRIVISLDAGDSGTLTVNVNGETSVIDLEDVRRIRVEGIAGNDRIVVSEREGRIRVRTRLEGGLGDDFIKGGSGRDNTFGGAGDDEIHGGRGGDDLDGGGDDDDLFGDDDLDDLDGGRGMDDLDGGRGRDEVHGGDGRDVFHARDRARERKDVDDLDSDDDIVVIGQVPEAVRAAFDAAYPDAVVRKVEHDDDEEAYEFEFLLGGVELEAKYDAAGNFLEGELTFAQLPDAVRQAFEAAHPDAVIDEIEFEDEGDEGLVYKIEFFTTGDETDEIKITADGGLVSDEDDEEEIGYDQLPAAVKEAFRQAFPDATVEKVERDGDEFEIEFLLSGEEESVEFDAEGNWLD